jgi:hypothetical protein
MDKQNSADCTVCMYVFHLSISVFELVIDIPSISNLLLVSHILVNEQVGATGASQM